MGMKTWNKPESVVEIDNAHKKYDLAHGVAKKLENLARFKVSSKIASPIKNLPPEQQQNPKTEQEHRPEESPNQPETQTAIQKSASKRSGGAPLSSASSRQHGIGWSLFLQRGVTFPPDSGAGERHATRQPWVLDGDTDE